MDRNFQGLVIIIIFSCLAITSAKCKKSDSTACSGGKGGSATLLVSAEAHGFPVDTGMIYIKYATKDFQANLAYDDSDSVKVVVTGGDTTRYAVFHSLQPGCYYLFAKGYHWGNVKGGVGATVQNNDSEKFYVPTYAY